MSPKRSKRSLPGTTARPASLCADGSYISLESVPKRKSTASKTPVRLPSRSTSRRRVIDPDDLDELEELEPVAAANDNAISHDHQLTLFFRTPPGGADHVVVTALNAGGDQIVEDRSTTEIAKSPAQHANAVATACARWAHTEGRQTRFRVTWQAGDRVLASHQLVYGDVDPTMLDGTVESFLSQQQRHAEVGHRLHHEGFSMVQDAWKQLLSGAMRRIDALEKDNEQLRDRLRKAGDVEAEILVAQAAADIEQRSKTSEIVESRLLPILQHLIQKQLGVSTPANENGSADPKAIESILRQATGNDPSKLKALISTITTRTETPPPAAAS